MTKTISERRVAIVTGAAQGLGQGIAVALARDGVDVICVDLAGSAETVALARAAGGPGSEEAALDVTDSVAVDQLIESVVTRFGRLDIVVNNAGIYTFGEVAETSDAVVRRIFDVNFFAVFAFCRAASRQMKIQRHGRIINIASQVGKVARPRDGAYAASKGAVILLTQALALELGEFGITANSICPGTMLTPMAIEAITLQALQKGRTFDEERQVYIDAKIPVGRYGTAEDVGAMAVWLASDEASFVTGSAQNLTGGEQVFF